MTEIYIVDDDPLAIATLTLMLFEIPDTMVVGSSTNPLEALKALGSGNLHADITLLDIQMKTMSGLELAGLLYDKTNIIFISAHSKFAVTAFDDNYATDYILKPVSPERLLKGITRVKTRMEQLKQKQTEHFNDEFFFMKLDGKNRYLKVKKGDIQYLEGAGNYTHVQLKDAKHLSHLSMSALTAILPEKQFFKIQKSYVINLDHIERISGNDVQMSNGIHLLIGEVYRKAFYERLNLGGGAK